MSNTLNYLPVLRTISYLHAWLDEKKCLLEVQIVFPIVWSNTFCLGKHFELTSNYMSLTKLFEKQDEVPKQFENNIHIVWYLFWECSIALSSATRQIQTAGRTARPAAAPRTGQARPSHAPSLRRRLAQRHQSRRSKARRSQRRQRTQQPCRPEPSSVAWTGAGPQMPPACPRPRGRGPGDATPLPARATH